MPIMPNPVRICFVNLEEPSSYKGGKPRYSVSVLIPKTDSVNKKFIDDQVKAAVNKGKDKFWKGKVPQGLKVLCQVPGQVMRDGDAEQRENGGTVGPEYKGCWFFTAAKSILPERLMEVEKLNAQDRFLEAEKLKALLRPILMRRVPVAEREGGRAVEEADPSIFYSGCTVKLDINLYPMSDNAINAGLNAVIFVKETPRLDGQPSKSAVIAAYTDEGVDEDEEDVPMTDDFNE